MVSPGLWGQSHPAHHYLQQLGHALGFSMGFTLIWNLKRSKASKKHIFHVWIDVSKMLWAGGKLSIMLTNLEL